MLRVGLNPYGLTYTVGLQGAGTARANPDAIGVAGFVALARDIGSKCIELDSKWLTAMTAAELDRLREQLLALDVTTICSHGLAQTRGETLTDVIRCAAALRSSLIRLHLTPVLEGARAAYGPRWLEMVDHARTTLIREAPRAAASGVSLAIENHQDFGSEELLALADEAGDNVGIVFDTGNPFAVGEDPVACAARIAPRVRHLHLKDYRAQFTEEGYLLIRCAIGDGAAPLTEIAAALAPHHTSITASLEPGALEARHIRAFTREWWTGYPPRDASEFGVAIGRLQSTRLAEGDDCRTPWEMDEPRATIVAYERALLRRSVESMRARGWM